MFDLRRTIRERSARAVGWLAAFVLCLSASVASAETLLMPNRDYLMGDSEVVWGITTLPNGAATQFTIDFGDGVVTAPANVTDRSYIAVNHTYNASGTFTVTLTVTNGPTTETATATVNVYNGGTLSAFDLRNLNINRAIQNGLRYLWRSQSNRTTFDTNTQTSWDGVPYTALVVQAFQNHGYTLPNSAAAPTGIYPKYVVRRGLNFVLSNLTAITLANTPAGNDPCVNVPAPACQAFYANTTFDPGYENAVAFLALAGSGAPNRVLTEITGGNAATINGKTIGEMLQRMVNATIWGQNDSGTGRGGWFYTFNSTSSDGSTNGWDLLGLLDAAGAGGTVPAWVKSEFALALAAGLNNDGSYDYQADGNRASNNSVNVAKAGVGIQGMFFTGRPNNDPDLVNALAYIGARWGGAQLGQSFNCWNNALNKGCGYAMFNVFKGLKLYGIQTLPGVGRPAGPGSIPADDWYADYEDWLVANQTNPLSTTGGNWDPLAFSCCSGVVRNGEAALALLILAPVTLVLPDPGTFSTVGLKHGNPLTTDPQTNPVTNPAGTHTVTAITTAANGNPIAGATVNFSVISGPNAGASGQGTTGANGQVTFTYTDKGGAGQDQIRASVGNLQSNIVVKNWVVVVVGNKCDANGDNTVTNADLVIIRNANGQLATGPNDPRDGNSDGRINVADVRYCQLRLGQTFGNGNQ